jgi:hypothetical protein
MILLNAPLWQLAAWGAGISLIAVAAVAGQVLKDRLRRRTRDR